MFAFAIAIQRIATVVARSPAITVEVEFLTSAGDEFFTASGNKFFVRA